MKILVTGSSGTVGTRLCEVLLERGHDVVGVDWHPNKWNPALDKITVIKDLREEEGWKDVPRDVDAIIHLAANARVYDLVKDPVRARDNFITTFHMLEFARKAGIKKFIFSSSREVYGNAEAKEFTEDKISVDLCESPYTASKIGGEATVQAYRRCYGIKAVILRFSNVYGAYDDSDRIVPLFIRQAKEGKKLTVFGEGKCLDFTYIDDTINGVILALEQCGKHDGEVFNIAYGTGTTLVELAESIKKLTKSASEIVMAPPRLGEVTYYVADIAKAKKQLGYQPKISFEEGIRRTVSWYAEHNA
ncbi:hypothetical protein A3D88_01685 [Candidatus Peribacteria bacterium RIFCSPHIGHO2_02_FULL_52_16]|nr:MAG: hypothetical protein A2706_03925 [Candidatus Peribacteria bacterium RIFCSPHIGHO2_01_FULL_51_35]OGJ61031.1 MAG: hypothetical protein A3D88_01685 [Candidatus Peribacteria bacterium RIFCSPHIGHO2_02_FULL_52_16]